MRVHFVLEAVGSKVQYKPRREAVVHSECDTSISIAWQRWLQATGFAVIQQPRSARLAAAC